MSHLPKLIFIFVIFLSGCSNVEETENRTLTELLFQATEDEAKLSSSQSKELQTFYANLNTKAGIISQCRAQYPENNNEVISLVSKINSAGKVVSVWLVSGGIAGTCVAKHVNYATMPMPPFQPFFTQLHANP